LVFDRPLSVPEFSRGRKKATEKQNLAYLKSRKGRVVQVFPVFEQKFS
jgi:hypothetical protein